MTVSQSKSRAVILYLGGDKPLHPTIREDLILSEFDSDTAVELITYAAGVVKEMDSMQIDWTTNTLQTASTTYKAAVSRRHPELSDEAVDRLGAAYSFWWK
jgi:hypothetical protein